jgi:hypothetical protein
MKAFYKTAIALGLSLIILFLTIGSTTTANITSVIEIRDPVYNGANIIDILTNYCDFADTVDASHFAVFFYDIDEIMTT